MLSHRLPILASLVCVALGCSASNGSGTSGLSTPAVLDIGGKDCGLVTSFKGSPLPGDGLCITPPAPEAGFQIHYGPTNYNDPVEVGKYILQPGQEITDCVYFTTPNTGTVYMNQYHARMRPGSHHMLLSLVSNSGGTPGGASFGGGKIIASSGNNGPSACSTGLTDRYLFGAQTPRIDIAAVGEGSPENTGLAEEIPPKSTGQIQAHFINATSGPILREVWANLVLTPKENVTEVAQFSFLIGGFLMNVPMGQSRAITAHAIVPSGVPDDFRLIMATGHYHSHTTEFKAWATIAGQQVELLHDYNTLGIAPDPAQWYFESAVHNPVADPVKQTGGAYSGIVHLRAGDRVDWECDVTNNNLPGGLKFNNEVYAAEMCNLFGFYAPSNGTAPWSAFNP
jgi:hypothetical protein